MSVGITVVLLQVVKRWFLLDCSLLGGLREGECLACLFFMQFIQAWGSSSFVLIIVSFMFMMGHRVVLCQYQWCLLVYKFSQFVMPDMTGYLALL